MKKIGRSLVTLLLTTGTAQADNTVYYFGGLLGYGSASAKILWAPPTNGSLADASEGSPHVGVLIGYGKFFGPWYISGEGFGSFEDIKIRDNLNAPIGQQMELTRRKYYGLAVRFGYFTPGKTLLYLRIGGHGGTWTFYDSRVNNGTPYTFRQKNRFTMAPGLGFEVSLPKCLAIRTEWFYEFGPSIVAVNDVNTAQFSSAHGIKYQTFQVGLIYQF